MLTSADTQELTWWFANPAPVYVAGGVAAQTYEPRGSGVYDPTTDMRLVGMLVAASHVRQSEWSRVAIIMDGLGAATVDVLRRAFGPLPSDALSTKSFRYPAVAVITRPALERARTVAREDEHRRLLEVAQLDAMRDGCSPMSVAMRVLNTDRCVRAVVTDDMVRRAARRTLERALKADDVELLVAVKLEMQRLVDEAGDAYRAARSSHGATKRQAKAAQRKANEALLDEQLGKKRRKESERFEARLRRAS